MIQNRPCVNGILAAVLSASILPIHGALAKAKEKLPGEHKAVAKPETKKPAKPDAPKEDAVKPDAAPMGGPGMGGPGMGGPGSGGSGMGGAGGGSQ